MSVVVVLIQVLRSAASLSIGGGHVLLMKNPLQVSATRALCPGMELPPSEKSSLSDLRAFVKANGLPVKTAGPGRTKAAILADILAYGVGKYARKVALHEEGPQQVLEKVTHTVAATEDAAIADASTAATPEIEDIAVPEAEASRKGTGTALLEAENMAVRPTLHALEPKADSIAMALDGADFFVSVLAKTSDAVVTGAETENEGDFRLEPKLEVEVEGAAEAEVDAMQYKEVEPPQGNREKAAIAKEIHEADVVEATFGEERQPMGKAPDGFEWGGIF